MIKSIIIDDEINCIETLQWKLENYCAGISVVATFDNPVQGLAYLKKNKIDLLFLDIEMPLLNGFDILQELPKINFEVIFTTAYESYGVTAVKFSAFDYLLKPIRVKELTDAVNRFKQRRPSSSLSTRSTKLSRKPSRITLATKESLELVGPEEIVYCASDSNYTMVYLKDGRKKLISRTLREFEVMLTPYEFFRPHNSFLVNMNQVKEYVKTNGGYLILKNKQKIPVSKGKKENLLRMF